MDRSESKLGEPLTRLLPLGLGLLYLGKQESVEATIEVSNTFNDKIKKYYDMTLLSCAYAGTGNVLFNTSLVSVLNILKRVKPTRDQQYLEFIWYLWQKSWELKWRFAR